MYRSKTPKKKKMKTDKIKNKTKRLLGGLMVISLVMLPYFESSAQRKSTHSSSHSTTTTSISVGRSGKQSHTYKTNSVFGSFSIDMRGEITLNDAETDIKSISEGGYFKVSKTTFGTKRTVKIENKGDNRLIRTFLVGRNAEPYYPDGQKWLADILPEIIRNTGIAAEQRVARIFKKSGTEGVLEEISEINSDYVKRKYFEALLDLTGLPDGDIPNIINKIGAYMDSSYEVGKILGNNADRFLQNEASSRAFFRVAGRISSDYEKGKILTVVLDDHDIDDQVFEDALDATSTISSDYEVGKVLKRILEKRDLSNQRLAQVMEIVEDVSSDYEKGKILINLSSRRDLDDKVFVAILNSADAISSDYEMGKVVKALADHQELDDEKLKDLLSVLDDISSDHEKKRLLLYLLDDNKFDSGNLDVLLEMTEDLSSDYERSKLYKSIFDEMELSDDQMVNLINALDDLSSDYEKSNILVKIADEVSDRGGKVKEAYLQVAKSISSDHSYGRVIRALD